MTSIASCLIALVLVTAPPVPEALAAGDWSGSRYDPAGRRDPFLPLVAPDAPDEIRGLQDVPWQKLLLVGIVEGPDGNPIALFYGNPGPRGHFLAPGARFRNGLLETIDPERGRVVIRGPRARRPGPPSRHVLVLSPGPSGG